MGNAENINVIQCLFKENLEMNGYYVLIKTDGEFLKNVTFVGDSVEARIR